MFNSLNPIKAALIAFVVIVIASCGGSGGGENLGPAMDFSISGTVQYEDKEYGISGFTGATSMKPVRNAAVEVVSAYSGAVLARGATDSNGAYVINFSDFYGRVAYVRVLASTSGSSIPAVTVGSPIVSFATLNITLMATPIAIDIPITSLSRAGGAFNILDSMTAAGQFVYAHEGSLPPPLLVRWTYGSSSGTYYWSNSISLNGGSYIDAFGVNQGDTDEYDDDIIWHEYGHFASDNFSVDDSPGGSHNFSENDQDIRLSWSEGWGNYFQIAIKRWLRADPSMSHIVSQAAAVGETHYIDTLGSGTLVVAELDTMGADPYIYSTNELAVAKVLNGFETNFSFQSLWDSLSLEMPYSTKPYTSLEAFWDGWVALEGASLIANSVLNERSIYYEDDMYEADDDTGSAAAITVNGASQTRYLYSTLIADDVDVIAFTTGAAGSYTIQTSCMRNGGDTSIRLLDTNGVTVLAQNDDTYVAAASCPGGFLGYSSKIPSISLGAANTYYVEVSSSPFAKFSPATGRYGTYDVSVTGP